jgi:hypothetical protein
MGCGEMREGGILVAMWSKKLLAPKTTCRMNVASFVYQDYLQKEDETGPRPPRDNPCVRSTLKPLLKVSPPLLNALTFAFLTYNTIVEASILKLV